MCVEPVRSDSGIYHEQCIWKKHKRFNLRKWELLLTFISQKDDTRETMYAEVKKKRDFDMTKGQRRRIKYSPVQRRDRKKFHKASRTDFAVLICLMDTAKVDRVEAMTRLEIKGQYLVFSSVR